MRYYHDVALGRGAALNVLNGGRGLDLNLHHDTGGRAGLRVFPVCSYRKGPRDTGGQALVGGTI